MLASHRSTVRRRALAAAGTAAVLALAACGSSDDSSSTPGRDHGPHSAAPPSASPSTGDMPGMDHMTAAGSGLSDSRDGYRLTSPETTLASGGPTAYRFTISGPDGKPVTAFALEQTRRMHFYAIRSDLTGRAGIGRATLYQYFPDAEAVLTAWHERQVSAHLHQLAEAAHRSGPATRRLAAVATAYAGLARQRHGGELAALLHQGEHVGHAERHLTRLPEGLIAEGARDGDLRHDVPPAELAAYCLHALTAASSLPSRAAIDRLVAVTLDGLRPAP